jgi:hypothetical protein
MSRRLIGTLVLVGATLGAVPSVADAEVIWGPMRFADGSKAQTVPYARGARVTGSVYICNDHSAYRTVSLGEYVRTGPDGQGQTYHTEIKTLPYNGACPGSVPVSWDIAPGPTRVLNFGFTGWGGSGSGYVGNYESVLDLTVTYRLTLSAAERKVRNGDSVFFSGVMPAYFFTGPPTVLLQVRSGKKWRTFKAMQTLQDGNYFATYRFTNTNSKQTYKFRAKPFGASLYPFAVRASKKARVTVKP